LTKGWRETRTEKESLSEKKKKTERTRESLDERERRDKDRENDRERDRKRDRKRDREREREKKQSKIKIVHVGELPSYGAHQRWGSKKSDQRNKEGKHFLDQTGSSRVSSI